MPSRTKHILVISRTPRVTNTVTAVCERLTHEHPQTPYATQSYDTIVFATVMIDTESKRKYTMAVVEVSDTVTSDEHELLRLLRNRSVRLVIMCVPGSRAHVQLQSDPHVVAIVHEADPTAVHRILGHIATPAAAST